MAKYENQPYSKKRLSLDGNTYVNCHFDGCTLVYAGGEFPRMTGCSVVNGTWKLEGAASNTIDFLALLHDEDPESVQGFLDFIAGKNRARGPDRPRLS